MLRVLLRLFALLLLAAAFSALVIDGTKSIGSDSVIVTPLAQVLAEVAPAKFPLMQAAVEKRFGPWAWDPALKTLLALPAWLFAGALGGALFAATRRRVVRIGYSSR